MDNLAMTQNVIGSLISLGVREFCVCAGARNAPLVVALESFEGIIVHRFFEERSSAFFALGRIHRDRRPVAVVTTSGTAVAELLPACIEADYTQQALILLTADRPQNYRGTGSPQSIEQIGIFSHYVDKSFDLDINYSHENFLSQLCAWEQRRPIHINLCYEEPLLSGLAKIQKKTCVLHDGKKIEKSLDDLSSMKIDRPLIIVGGLRQDKDKDKDERDFVIEQLLRMNAPIYVEALSGLNGRAELQHLFLRSGEVSVARAFSDFGFKSVIRIGAVPTLRFWRDLEATAMHIPVYSFSDSRFSGLSRQNFHYPQLANLSRVVVDDVVISPIFAWDRERRKSLETLFAKFPHSEPSMIHQLSLNLVGASVFLGNSMPIREWDLAADSKTSYARVHAHRGVNGIDGQISGFLGWCAETSENWAVIGDLTALYDLSALWLVRDLVIGPTRIVVINNGGGMIFKNIFNNDEKFLNRHNLRFQKWAEMFHWSYQALDEIPKCWSPLFDREIIEVFPNEVDTAEFWKAYKNL